VHSAGPTSIGLMLLNALFPRVCVLATYFCGTLQENQPSGPHLRVHQRFSASLHSRLVLVPSESTPMIGTITPLGTTGAVWR